MKLNADKWFTEVYPDDGCALSLEFSEKLHEEKTGWQKLEVYQTTGFGRLMLLDGCIMLTDRDNFIYHEMMTHPALCSHPDPKRVLIIGGGDCGCLREVLKHKDIKHAHQVDLDESRPRLIPVTERPDRNLVLEQRSWLGLRSRS